MEEAFDAYHIWLGIRAEDQPPNHYRLLGIRLFEDQAEAIEHAAEQRMAHLRSLQSGKHASWSQKLLNEVAAARVCLLHPQKKAAYDEQLRVKLATGLAEAATRQPALSSSTPATHSSAAHTESAGEITSEWVGLGQLGEYELIEKLGEGGMGSVFKAMHTKLGRVVAIKVLPPDRLWDDRAKARFDREMKAVGALDHPNIVRAMDAREVDGTRILVMEYVDGIDLAELVRRCHPMPVADACELIRQAALGLEDAHQHGLVHRDVKASNLMLSRQGVVKLLDLGLARFELDQTAAEEVTAAGQAVGTVEYMAPEQVSDAHHVDIRADIYSLGCTFYKLLSGQTPFGGPEYRGAVQRAMAHVQDPVPSLRRFRGDVPESLTAVIDRMLAKNPADRFATPAQAADAVGLFAMGSNVTSLLARAEGRTMPPAPPFQVAVAAAETESDSSGLTRFFQQVQTASHAAPAEEVDENPWVRFAIRTGLLAVIVLSVLIAAVWAAKHRALLAGQGTLLIDWPAADRNGASMEIDGTPLQLTDAAGPVQITCAAGEHRVVLRRPGFQPYEEQVDVAAGGSRTISPMWVPWSYLVLLWPAAERNGAELEIDGKPVDLAAQAESGDPAVVRLRLEPGPHKVRISRAGFEPDEHSIMVIEAEDVDVTPLWVKAGGQPAGIETSLGPSQPKQHPPEPGQGAPEPGSQPTPQANPPAAPPSEAEQQRLAAEKKYQDDIAPAEAKVTAWDFAGALALLGQVRPTLPPLQARLAARTDQLRRMAAMKTRIIARINQGSPRLQKSDLLMRGINGDLTHADETAITTELKSGKTELHPWQSLGPQSVQKVLLEVIDRKIADDWIASGLLLAASSDPAGAEKSFQQAAALGADVRPYSRPPAP